MSLLLLLGASSTATALVVADATSASTADNVILIQAHALTVADSASAATIHGQILGAVSDVAINSWTTNTGAATNLYQSIDENPASDIDYVQSAAAATAASYYETSLL